MAHLAPIVAFSVLTEALLSPLQSNLPTNSAATALVSADIDFTLPNLRLIHSGSSAFELDPSRRISIAAEAMQEWMTEARLYGKEKFQVLVLYCP